MTATLHPSQVRQHRIASYGKGCRCDDCISARRLAGQRMWAARYRARDRRPSDEMCPLCACWFNPRGITRHEMSCRG